jgi:hypothetical protein
LVNPLLTQRSARISPRQACRGASQDRSAKIEARAKERFEQEMAAYRAKLAAREAKAAATWRRSMLRRNGSARSKRCWLTLGYFSEANVMACAAADVEPLIVTGRQPHHPSWREAIHCASKSARCHHDLFWSAGGRNWPESKVASGKREALPQLGVSGRLNHNYPVTIPMEKS